LLASCRGITNCTPRTCRRLAERPHDGTQFLGCDPAVPILHPQRIGSWDEVSVDQCWDQEVRTTPTLPTVYPNPGTNWQHTPARTLSNREKACTGEGASTVRHQCVVQRMVVRLTQFMLYKVSIERGTAQFPYCSPPCTLPACCQRPFLACS